MRIDPYAIDTRPLRDHLPELGRQLGFDVERWIFPENRPSRLLGPAVPPLVTHERGCCMVCGQLLSEPPCADPNESIAALVRGRDAIWFHS